MQTISFQDALDLIHKKDTRYHRDAYAFVREALEAALKQRKKAADTGSCHVSAAELMAAFQQHALKEFGPMAITVLDYWGVKNTADIGNMVFNLINAGVFRKTDEDTHEAFQGGFDFHDVFVKPFLPMSADNTMEGVSSRP
jgi:uncharacterized repeat protein (TIGR04138 family)